MWVDGLLAFAPAPFTYLVAGSDRAAAGERDRALVYLDVFEEHVQPAEDPPSSSTRRSARSTPPPAPASATGCESLPTTADHLRASPGPASSRVPELDGAALDRPRPRPPCRPTPARRRATRSPRLPDGLLPRRGARRRQRGDRALRLVVRERRHCGRRSSSVAGNQVTLAPSNAVKFANGDLVEVSWLARRADRVDHGALYTSRRPPETGAGGDIARARSRGDRAGRRSRPRRQALGRPGRRRGGRARRRAGTATRPRHHLHRRRRARTRSATGGVRASAEEAGDGIEHRTSVRPGRDPARVRAARARRPRRPDGALGLPADVRLARRSDRDAGACTVSVKPGDDLQAALDSLPAGGGELCLAAGVYAGSR